jgi:hypothetical protein
MMGAPAVEIDALNADSLVRHLDALTDILHACVHDGASVGFILPFEPGEARAYWTGKVAPALSGGARVVLVATLDGAMAGTVQLDLDTWPNQRHRADVAKLLVHPRHRRQGVARALMTAIEARARDAGRQLLTLDTAGDGAERLYASLGYAIAGRIAGYARAALEDRLEATTYMFKQLGPLAAHV